MSDADRTGGPGRPLVLLFSDSLAMPREFLETEERTVYADTYPARLRSLLAGHADVDAVSSVGLDSENALYEARFQVLPRRPDVLVLHLGINDCAPRVFRKGSTSSPTSSVVWAAHTGLRDACDPRPASSDLPSAQARVRGRG